MPVFKKLTVLKKKKKFNRTEIEGFKLFNVTKKKKCEIPLFGLDKLFPLH